MRFSVYSALALASIVSAAPSLHSRQAATVRHIDNLRCLWSTQPSPRSSTASLAKSWARKSKIPPRPLPPFKAARSKHPQVSARLNSPTFFANASLALPVAIIRTRKPPHSTTERMEGKSQTLIRPLAETLSDPQDPLKITRIQQQVVLPPVVPTVHPMDRTTQRTRLQRVQTPLRALRQTLLRPRLLLPLRLPIAQQPLQTVPMARTRLVLRILTLVATTTTLQHLRPLSTLKSTLLVRQMLLLLVVIPPPRPTRRPRRPPMRATLVATVLPPRPPLPTTTTLPLRITTALLPPPPVLTTLPTHPMLPGLLSLRTMEVPQALKTQATRSACTPTRTTPTARPNALASYVSERRLCLYRASLRKLERAVSRRGQVDAQAATSRLACTPRGVERAV